MRTVYTREQAKAIDSHAINTMGFPGLVLMEKAAMSVAAVLMEKESKNQRILCVCGMGNNGGDGAAIARILKQAGYFAAICPVGDPDHMTDDMKKQMELAVNCRVPVLKTTAIERFDVIVDALFGIGLTREVEGVYAKVIEQINSSSNRVYAVDIPSGVDGSTGRILGCAVQAKETITFGVNKVGLILYPGCEYAGVITVADIGFPVDSVASVYSSMYIYESEDVFRLPFRPNRSHKGTFGHVLVIAGSKQMSGACYLAAKAAYTMGAGLVKVITPECNRNIILSMLPEVLFSSDENLQSDLEWADAVLIGPGLSLDERAVKLVETVIENSKKPTVVDGDAITLLGDRSLNEQFILTPHLKEMTRVTGDSVSEIADAMIETAKSVASEHHYIVALKDSRTIVSNGEECYINVSGNNGMATGGSGDVLAGTIAGLLAGGMEPFEAAKLGVYIHGLAGDCMIHKKGHYGLMASDLIQGLCLVTREETKTN